MHTGIFSTTKRSMESYFWGYKMFHPRDTSIPPVYIRGWSPFCWCGFEKYKRPVAILRQHPGQAVQKGQEGRERRTYSKGSESGFTLLESCCFSSWYPSSRLTSRLRISGAQNCLPFWIAWSFVLGHNLT